jgi:hypothetical protein
MSTKRLASDLPTLVLLPNYLDAGYGHKFSFRKSPQYRAFRRRLIPRIAAASHSRSSACDRPPACALSCLTHREGSAGTRLVDG